MSLNTNTYLIGMSMILLNLGGRHLAPSLTTEQDKFFQNVWIRRAMLFVVIFVATRNVITALWLTIGLVLTIGYLFNEHSSLYLFGEPVPIAAGAVGGAGGPAPVVSGLTPEEQEIYKRLSDKVTRIKSSEELRGGSGSKPDAEKKGVNDELVNFYKDNMRAMQRFVV